jgi:LacI family repressor for deo operon, udp, cdd, tsx, nupC, and nupG
MDVYDKLSLNSERGITFVLQLKQQIAWLIANGQLPAGEKLPPVQVMAQRLGINLHTVRKAYRMLATEGMVESRQGRGTHILPFDTSRLAQIAGATRSHTVGVIIPSWTNPFYHALLQGIEEAAEEDQTLLFLCNTHDDLNIALRDVARLAAKQVDGILIASHNVNQLLPVSLKASQQLHGLPIVSIDWPGYTGYSVLTDLQMAGFQATQHLITHGHRRIGLITFAVDAENVAPVNRGYQQALEETGWVIDPDLIARVPGFGITAGIEGARMLLGLKNPPTAFFAISDMLALGVIQAVKTAGLQIPADIAVTSFNDIPTSALIEPSLTTVAAPTVQMGYKAMEMLQSLIAGKQPPQREIILPTALVVRNSCGDHFDP